MNVRPNGSVINMSGHHHSPLLRVCVYHNRPEHDIIAPSDLPLIPATATEKIEFTEDFS